MRFMIIAATSGFLAVAFGAFGSHALRSRIGEDMLRAYQIGVDYHFYHTFALLITAWFFYRTQEKWFKHAAVLFATGILLFSGSLYLYAITNLRWLAIITPFGGLSFLGGWLFLIFATIRHK